MCALRAFSVNRSDRSSCELLRLRCKSKSYHRTHMLISLQIIGDFIATNSMNFMMFEMRNGKEIALKLLVMSCVRGCFLILQCACVHPMGCLILGTASARSSRRTRCRGHLLKADRRHLRQCARLPNIRCVRLLRNPVALLSFCQKLISADCKNFRSANHSRLADVIQ